MADGYYYPQTSFVAFDHKDTVMDLILHHGADAKFAPKETWLTVFPDFDQSVSYAASKQRRRARQYVSTNASSLPMDTFYVLELTHTNAGIILQDLTCGVNWRKQNDLYEISADNIADAFMGGTKQHLKVKMYPAYVKAKCLDMTQIQNDVQLTAHSAAIELKKEFSDLQTSLLIDGTGYKFPFHVPDVHLHNDCRLFWAVRRGTKPYNIPGCLFLHPLAALKAHRRLSLYSNSCISHIPSPRCDNAAWRSILCGQPPSYRKHRNTYTDI